MKRKWFSILLVVVAILALVAQPATANSSTVVISEFRTRGPNGTNDQFIELYNLSAVAVDISEYSISVWDPVNGPGYGVYDVAQLGDSVILQPYEHYLIVYGAPPTGYSGSTAADDYIFYPMQSDSVGIALIAADGSTVVDAVSTTNDAGNPYLEGTALAPMISDINQSYERLPGTLSAAGGHINTQDTDDNSADFKPNTGSSNPESQASDSPTAVTLRDFSAQAQPSAAWLPVALLIALSGAWVMLRRRRA